MDRILFGFNTIFIFRYPLMKRKLEGLMRGRLIQETEGADQMDKDALFRVLLVKAEEVVDQEGVFEANGDLVEVDAGSDDEDEDDRRDNQYGKLMSYEYDVEEQKQDV